jgi:6-phosphogluconolactonase
MKAIEQALAVGIAAAALGLPASAAVEADNIGTQRAVFVMTNDPDDNQIVAYERTAYGTLQSPHRFLTGGRGSGGKLDPLSSQGSLKLSADRSTLLAANAGSGTVSVFLVAGSRLLLTDRVTTGGSEPNAVAQRGNLVYVLNTAGSSSVVGFHLQGGRLTRLHDSQRFLSGNLVNPASIAFSSDGRYLLVTERATNTIDVFKVSGDGTLSELISSPSAGPGAFSATVAPSGTVLVSETGTGIPNSSALSSYSIGSDGHLVPLSISVPTLGNANCWNVVTPNGRFVYISNAGSSSLAGFQISANGALQPIGSTIVATNPSGAANLDITISADGNFLYSLNGGNGSVGMFAIERDGTLVNLGATGGLPANAGLNGIAAN